MTDSLHRSIFAGKDLPQTCPQGITEADVLITGSLANRPARQPDLAAENQALRTLAQHLMDDPQSLLKTLVGIALNLCRADTVGVSLLETAPNGESLFRWVAIAGTLEPLEQSTTPGNFSPCGTTLSCNQPQLYSHPERYFTYLYHPQFPIVEGLLIPLCVNDHPLGTLWIVSHSGTRHFDVEDQRLIMSLGDFAVSALDRMQQLQQTAAMVLRQSEQFNQQILDSSDDCIKVLDLEGRILFMSRGGQASLSIQDITPFLNTPWVEFWSESDRQAATEAIARARAGEVCTLQGYCPTLSGEPKWWDNKISPIRGADGQVERLLCISRDITEQVRVEDERRRIENERKQAEAALRQSEQRFRLMADAVPQIVWITDAQGQVQFFNKQWSDYTGVPYEPTTAAEVAASFVHPDDGARTMEAFNEARRSGGVFSVEHRIRSAAGTYRWFLVRADPYRDQQTGEIVRWFGASVDIHDRKQAEAEREQLLANERQYANQLQELTTAALAINSALSVEEVLQVITNQAASIIGTHQSVTSLTINQNWVQAINTIYLSEKYAAWRDYNELTDGSGIYACVCHLNRPMRMTQAELEAHPHWKGFGRAADKHPPLRGWLAAPLVGRDRQNIGLIQLSDKYEGEFTPSDESILMQLAQMASVAVENARLYKAEQQARAAAEASREEAQAANRVKDEFLAVLSHELRSPLNPILGWSKLLQSRKLDETKIVQALSTIERNAKLQSELIEDLLDVSRILQGKLSLNVAPVNLASIIRAAIETVRLAAEAKSIQVEASLAPDVGLVSGDSTRLQQVIWNLLSNAVKFTPPGGQVNIRLERLDSCAQITVSDTGQGIAPDFLPYVFDYFRQANAATTRKFGGLGLGLAIVRHLVELHGGTVRADSPGEGQGATFVVRLPLMPTPLKANQDEQSPEQSLDLNGIKILVVDDETDTRELVVFLLEQQGAQVTAASSAHEALLALTQAKPDVLLSDIGMPDMDGYMLIQQVRTLAPEQGGQIPAIALTAYAGETNQQQVIAAGFQKHISKPIEPEVLVQAIAQLVCLRSTDTEFPTSEVF